MDEAAQARGARSLGAPESGQCHGPAPDRLGPRRGMADHEGGLSQGQRQRHAAGSRPADHVCGAASHPGDGQIATSARRFDQYFTQQLLPEYIEEKGVAWNVVYDARGHFLEPHTEHEVPLGTLQVEAAVNVAHGRATAARLRRSSR